MPDDLTISQFAGGGGEIPLGDFVGSAQSGTRPAMPSATGALASLPGRMLHGATVGAQGLLDTLAAAYQRTSPIVQDMNGQANYTPLGRLTGFDYGPGFINEAGQDTRFNPDLHAVLRDPQSGELTVYERNQQTEEGLLPSLGRVLGFGALTSPLTRLASPRTPLSPAARLLQDFDAQGVPPTLPGVMQSRVTSTAANVLRDAPVASGRMETAARNSLEATANAAERNAANYGTATTPAEAGRSIQSGVERFAGTGESGLAADDIIRLPTRESSFGEKAGALYDRLAARFGDGDMSPLSATRAELGRLNNQFPNAPGLGRILENRTFPQIEQALGENGLSVPELFRLRTRVGAMMRGGSLRDDIPMADLRQLYRAISEDIGAAARAVETRSPGTVRDFERANGYYSAGMRRIEDALEGIQNLSAEGAYGRVQAMAGSRGGADIASLRALQRSMPADEWRDVAATWLRNAGRPTAGASDPLAGAANWSPTTFITNYERLSPEARALIFDGAGQSGLRESYDQLVRVVAAQRNVERMANTSRTGPFLQIMGTLTGMATAPVATGSALAGGAVLAQAMTRPSFVRWLVRAPTVREPSEIPQYVARLRAMGQMEPEVAPAYNAIADWFGGLSPARAQDERREQ